MLNCHSSLWKSPLEGPGQLANRGLAGCGGISVLLLFVLGLGTGCGSIYRQTRAKLPPEPCAQLHLRVTEAQRAENLAEQTITRLRDRLTHGVSGAALETAIDRVEAAAVELERQVASARGAAAHCEGQTQLGSEIERLHRRASKLLEYVQAVRRGGNSTNARQLDDLLDGAANP